METLEDRVARSKKDSWEKNKLISEFKPFIASVVQKKTGKFVEYGVDDELSSALSAFNEAIDTYDIKKGKFLSFARMVINLRLIDLYRSAKKKGPEISIDNDVDESMLKMIDKKSIEDFRIFNENEDLKFEVIEYSQILREWNIKLESLVKVSPKQNQLREEYKKAAKTISDTPLLLEELMKNKRIPVKELEKISGLHRKKIERGRIYIIAIVLAILKNFSYLDICGGDSKK